jgi:hypothetical protein
VILGISALLSQPRLDRLTCIQIKITQILSSSLSLMLLGLHVKRGKMLVLPKTLPT